MTKLVILGTATNIPDATHENTFMVLVGDERMVLIDGPGNPYSRMLQAELDVTRLTDIVMTHFHPDHVAGIPLLLMAMGLSGRQKPLNLYSNQHCMDNMLNLLKAFTWDKWHSFPVNCITIPEEELSLIIEEDEFKIFSSPVKHFIPAIGIRVEFPRTGKVFAYSGDTAPTPSLEGLAMDADVLIHEAAGASIGHSSAAQAAQLAEKINAKDLHLVHYPVGGYDPQNLIDEAVEFFGGELFIAEDFDELDF